MASGSSMSYGFCVIKPLDKFCAELNYLISCIQNLEPLDKFVCGKASISALCMLKGIV